MNLTNLFKIAFKALSNNKLRGFLTMLGIIIGVGSVITMLAIGQGSKRSIQAQISEMGSNMIMIHPGGDRRGGVRLDAADMESLKLKDLEAIQTQARYISYISPSVNSSGQAIFGANNTPAVFASCLAGIQGAGGSGIQIQNLDASQDAQIVADFYNQKGSGAVTISRPNVAVGSAANIYLFTE